MNCFHVPIGWVLLCSQVNPEPAQLVLSVKTWEGEYASRDTPGGVETTPVVGAIYTMRADGSCLRKLVQLGKNTDNPAFSPDGRWIYFQSNATGRSHVYRCLPDGSRPEDLSGNRGIGKRWKDAFGYVLSWDGKRLLYTVHDGSTGRLVLSDADGARPRLLFSDVGYTYMGALSPTGDRVVMSGPAHGYRLLIAELPEGKPLVLTPSLPDSFVPQFSPDGRWIVFVRRDGDIYRVGVDGRDLRRLTEGNRYVEFHLSDKDTHGSTDGPQISPNGEKIAYVARKAGVPQVCVMNSDGTRQQQLSFRRSACGRVRWNPDGKSIAFVSFDGKYPQLFLVSADGGEPRQLTRLNGAVYFVNWKR